MQGQPTAGQTQEPYRSFASEGDLNNFVAERVKRAERSALKKLAADLGFEDADELRDALQPLRRTAGGGNTNAPATPTQPTAQGPSDSARLSMALKVGAELNLPASLIARLQGDTEEAMKADAQALLGLMDGNRPGATAPRAPGIPPVPQVGQPVTFTRTQLQDAKFVREHANEIRQAAAQGRIVNS